LLKKLLSTKKLKKIPNPEAFCLFSKLLQAFFKIHPLNGFLNEITRQVRKHGPYVATGGQTRCLTIGKLEM
jgi:hypothetical protein